MSNVTYDGLIFGATSPVVPGSVGSAVKLSTIISRMQRWTTIYRNTEEQFLVYDLDEALRNLQRSFQTPWTLKKTTLRVFDGILEYPKPSDELAIAFIEGQEDSYEDKPRPYYTSIQEFYEDPNNQSQYAEIWNAGTAYIGVRNKNISSMAQVFDSCETDENYTISGDFTSKAIDTVFYKTGSGSLRMTVVNSTDTAALSKTFSGYSDAMYKRKYVFFKVYLSSAPTSITINFGADSSNYLTKTVSSQFSGQGFVANDWNTIAFDLNSPDSTVGTISANTIFSYYELSFTGLANGDVYLDEGSVRGWDSMDYYYYSAWNVMSSGATAADKKYFLDSNNQYEPNDSLVCPEEYVDVVMYDAMTTTITDVENSAVYKTLMDKRASAWDNLVKKYPSLEPIIITHGWRFGSQMGNVAKWYEN